MKTKYIHERLDGSFVYPNCPETIKSKEDLRRWFEHTCQITDDIDDKNHLLTRLPSKFITEQSNGEIKMLFPRCQFSAIAKFLGKECYGISI